jgi:flagellar hook protein FlgE
LTFDATGKLTSPAAGASPTIAISGLADGANDMSMSFNLYDGSNPLITQYAQPSGSSSNFSDGSAAGQFVSASIQNGGQIVVTYSNDKQVVIGQLAVANFTNPDSLIAVGNNAYQTSGSTSNPSIGQAGTGGRGDIQGSALEGSTADIATEFTNLMVSQRSYEANSKVVTTADTLNQDVINLIH